MVDAGKVADVACALCEDVRGQADGNDKGWGTADLVENLKVSVVQDLVVVNAISVRL